MRLARLVASGLGAGYSPAAPGTAGSLLALLLGAGMMALHPALLPIGAVAATLAGFWAISQAKVEGDPGWVVIDEVAGQWIALLALPGLSVTGLLLAFVVFRLLDITKPGPIGWADQQPGPMGVMLDDVLAGVLAAGVLLVARLAWPGLL